MKMAYFPSKTVIAICGIVVLEMIALLQGVDGLILTTAMATIAALAGYTLSEAKK